MTSPREFDAIIWGATGHTAKKTTEYIAIHYGLPSEQFKYAIAGRDESRLIAVEKNMIEIAEKAKTTHGAKAVPKIIASLTDEASLKAMVKRAKVVIALAGPYAQVGEPVVKACAEAGTHYVDVTGEGEWISEMRDKHNELAKKNKAKIVPGVGGLEFMPTSINMSFLDAVCEAKKFQLLTVDQHVSVNGADLSGGTTRTLVDFTRKMSFCKFLKGFVDPFRFCRQEVPRSTRRANIGKFGVRYDRHHGKWCAPHFAAPFMGAYMRLDNEMQNFKWGRNIVFQVDGFYDSFFRAWLAMVFYYFASFFIFFACKLLPVERILPKVGTGFRGTGHFIGDTSRADYEGKKYSHELLGVAEVADLKTQELNTISFKQTCPYESYDATAISVVECALTMLKETCPDVYGVTSSNAAIGRALNPRLLARNIKIETIETTKVVRRGHCCW